MAQAGQHLARAVVVIAAAALSGCAQQVWAPPAVPSSTTTSIPGCPPVEVRPGRYVNIDFTDFVVHNGVNYAARPEESAALTQGQVGPELFRVICTFSTLNQITQSELPDPTEDSAGFIPAGSPVFRMKGWPEACRLAAKYDGRWVVYVATIDTPQASTFNECGLDPIRWADDKRP